jgi:hypothetical protein
MLRSVFESRSEDVAGEGKQLHDEALHNLYATPDIVSMIK